MCVALAYRLLVTVLSWLALLVGFQNSATGPDLAF
jgi:hypothetical protein